MRCPTRRIEDFSLMDPGVQSDPFPFYELLQEQCPVYRMPETGFYVVTRYEDLRKVLSDHSNFSNDTQRAALQGEAAAERYQQLLGVRGWRHVQTLQRTDPPVHIRYRRLVDRVFTVGRVREMVPRIERVAASLIDQFIDAGSCEFVADYAMPLPGIIIAEELGLPPSEIEVFKRWADAMLASSSRVLSPENMEIVAATEVEAQLHMADLFVERRARPRDDLVSALVHAGDTQADQLSVDELQSIMSQLINGGFESTMSAIAHGLWLLIRNPDQMTKLRADRRLMRGFVEETLRIESPVQGLRRRAVRDTEVGGTLIPEGAIVVVRYGAANRDPHRFPDPGRFDIERANAATHLAFGTQPHFCVGAVLARQEIAIGIGAILDRLGDIQLARPLDAQPHEPNFSFLPLKELPIRFSRLG